MLRKILYAITISFFTSSAFAQGTNFQIQLPKEHQIPNPTQRRCALCSLEVLGRTNKIKRLEGLANEYEGPLHLGNMMWILQTHKVEHKINPIGNKTDAAILEFLKKACDEKRGAAVGVDFDRHMLNVIDYDIKNETIGIFDNSNPQLELHRWKWLDFYHRWSGFAIVIYPDKK